MNNLQDDVLMGMLTVRENIAFSAALRLPSSVSNKEKTQRVAELIEDLGLTKCADTKVCVQPPRFKARVSIQF